MCTKQEGMYLSVRFICVQRQPLLLPHLFCSSPINPPFSKCVKASFSFSVITFPPLSCLHSLTPAFFREETDKNKTFFWKKECWTCQNKKRENWKWKDVHEILRVTAAALCNSQSVIVHKYVHACSRICMHLYIFIYLSSFARSSWKMPLCEKNRWQFFGCLPVPHLSTGMLM